MLPKMEYYAMPKLLRTNAGKEEKRCRHLTSVPLARASGLTEASWTRLLPSRRNTMTSITGDTITTGTTTITTTTITSAGDRGGGEDS